MTEHIKRVVKKKISGPLYNRAVVPKHLAVAAIANAKARFPARGLTVIGVTGTNGKTSTCFFIQRLLMEAGYNVGIVTTVSYGLNHHTKPQVGHMTSLPVGLLLARIDELKKQGMDILVLEVTSHALSQYRTFGIPIDIAVFTNLTQDHLDYHGSFAAYRAAKVKLFKLAAKNKTGRKLGVINMGDANAQYFARVVPNVMGYSLEESTVAAYPKNLKMTADGSTYDTTIGDEHLHITCQIPGKFNVANTLAAASVGVAMGVPAKVIEQGIAAVTEIHGRMTKVEAGQAFTVLVDFAHTPDALEKVLSAAKDIAKGQVRAVFGATGDRDKTKRPIMGRIAAGLADMIYLTDDETYTEDPDAIRAMVRSGIESAGGRYIEIGDREEAIRRALKDAQKGDVVVLAGIGHEDSRNMGGKLEPWDEIALARKVIREQ